MKKIFTLLIALAVVFTLTGCNTDPECTSEQELVEGVCEDVTVVKEIDCIDSQGVYSFSYEYMRDEIVSVSILGVTVTRDSDLTAIQAAEQQLKEEQPGLNFYEIFEEVYNESLEDSQFTCTIE